MRVCVSIVVAPRPNKAFAWGHVEHAATKREITVFNSARNTVVTAFPGTRKTGVGLLVAARFAPIFLPTLVGQRLLGDIIISVFDAHRRTGAHQPVVWTLLVVLTLVLRTRVRLLGVLSILGARVSANPLDAIDPVAVPDSTLLVDHAGAAEGRGGGVVSAAEDTEEGDHENNAVHEILHANSPWTICGPVIGVDVLLGIVITSKLLRILITKITKIRSSFFSFFFVTKKPPQL